MSRRDERLRKNWKRRGYHCLTAVVILFTVNIFIPVETVWGTFFYGISTAAQVFIFLTAGYCFNKRKELDNLC